MASIDPFLTLTNSTFFQVLLACAAAMLVLLGILGHVSATPLPEDPLLRLRRAMGANKLPYVWFFFAALFWGVLFLTLFIGMLSAIFEVVTAARPADEADKDAVWAFRFHIAQLAGLTAVFGAVIAFPFTVIRLKLATQENSRATEALYNDKINAALDDLHAMRQWSIHGDPDKTIWEADVTRRNGAIDRLEALAHEYPKDAPRIARTLCTYVKELSREYPPLAPPKDATPVELSIWTRRLTPARSDMESAAQTLGRLIKVPGMTHDRLAISLEVANLQRCRLGGLDFQKASLSGAFLKGAFLDEAQLQGADLFGAQLQGANLLDAQLQGASLRWAQLQGAFLFLTKIDPSTDFTEAETDGAAVKNVDWHAADITQKQVATMFGDASVKLPFDRPAHWPDTDLNWDDFDAELERFKRDPDAYVPP